MFALSRRLLVLVAPLLALACSPASASRPAPRGPEALAAPAVANDPGGIGTLSARTDSGETLKLRLQSVHVRAEQRGDMAEIEVTHRFENDADRVLEGTFRFPMPDGALLTGLAMEIDGKLVDGELVEREKARKAYESVVDAMADPALLEWEHGSTFKMRVFPLEPGRPKVVTLHYLAPLRRSGGELAFVQGTGTPAGGEVLPELVIDWQGRRVVDEHDVLPNRVFSLPAHAASPILREERPDGSYALVRVAPEWSRLAVDTLPVPKRWFVVVDTSRSALEEYPRELDALGVLLAKLPAGSSFELVTSDLTAQASPAGLVLVTPETIESALAALRAVTPDGASDLGTAFELVGRLAAAVPESALLYLGDCEPTWGVTGPQALRALVEHDLPGIPVFPVLFGASIDDELAAELAAASGGRRTRIRRREDVDALASALAEPRRRVRDVAITAAPGVDVLPGGPWSLERGDELVLVAKAPRGVDPLLGLHVAAKTRAGTQDLVPRAKPEVTTGVARRFGAALVQRLEKAEAPPPEVVKASLDYGVMSRFTSFLVLESEEAYARFAIERREKQAEDAPRVTGKDLESADGADISADRVQPGDPEILIDAERDAVSVTVEFPFGATKRATYDLDARGGRGAWMVRFLVPRDANEGEYSALVRIVHRDGRTETRSVRYTVDRTAPELDVKLERSRRSSSFVAVVVTETGPSALSDLRRVELRTPSGRVHELTATKWGVFRARIPRSELEHGTLRVVGFDQALNHGVKELELP
ncbi:MAG TPA: VIT and VWA domain-containing protein [Polyangiaceae bacterium]|nr:VIT and VWA domain-containing protein [Polyangiaceae bacterium]